MTATSLTHPFSSLANEVRGQVVLPDAPAYTEARTIWNAMIDRRPAAIVRCTQPSDVIAAVNFAREHGLILSIRGGGHNIAGNAVCDGGLMIDLSLMKTVRIDPKTRRAFVGPGATLADFDREAQRFGLATPTGVNSTTGIAGLTLGGGFGWLTRVFGMTVDNLVSADVVTAEGRQVHASAEEHADLFWALRGGGGNFGVVTQFEFQLHPVGPDVFSGLLVFPMAEAKTVLQRYREYMTTAPRELNVWAVLRQPPPLPFLPPEVHGQGVLVVALFHLRGESATDKLIDPMRRFGTLLGQHVGVQPYASWQQAFDPLLAPGLRNYWKSHNFTGLPDEVIDVAVEYAGRLPSPHCEIFFAYLAGAASEVPSTATAYGNRDTKYVMNVHSRWESGEEDAPCIAWAREFAALSAPFSAGGVYVNFMTDDEKERVATAFGPNLARLQEVKAHYDPANLFRMNQNVRPHPRDVSPAQ